MLKSEVQRIKNGFSNFNEDKVGGIGAIVSLLAYVGAFTIFFIKIIIYASDGGYKNLFSKITTIGGNASDYYDAPILPIFLGFSLILVVLSYARYFKLETKTFKLLGGLMLVITVGCTIVYYVMYGLYQFGMYAASDKTRAISKGLEIGALAAIIISLILLMIREKELALGALKYLILVLVIMPLITCAVENPLLTVAIFIIFVTISIVIMIKSNKPAVPVDINSTANGNAAGATTGVEDVNRAQSVNADATGVTEKGQMQEGISRAGVGSQPQTTKTGAAAASQGVPPKNNLTKEQVDAIYDIEKRYKDGCKRIYDSDPNYNGKELTDNMNRQIMILRTELEKEAELRGVKEIINI